ncbi:MAG TPA: peptide MFS transporter [Candidatus Krumholzibacteria bacterium]|nr:peptide MFS transporter [Candidatus Krumholzibacteria bacterium]
MSAAATSPQADAIPEFKQLLGHPRPLWMLFMSEFWERFAFYGNRWALTLYIVAQFHQGDPSGQAPANALYGAYLALVYAVAIFGGYVADRVIGYQRSILVGAVIMAAGLFMVATSTETIFRIGLATIIAGNGLFKPNISTMVGKLYKTGDERRDSGFTIFYMGINAGAFIAPILTGWLASSIFGTDAMPAYKVVFIAAGIGMLLSMVWFYFGRRQLGPIGRPPEGGASRRRVLYVALGALVAVPVVYFLLTVGAKALAGLLAVLFIGLCVMLVLEGIREGEVARSRTVAMLIIFAFNILFWMFFEQAGSSFNFLADQIVDRSFGSWTFPVAWFQSINPIGILALAPVFAWLWIKLGKFNPSIPRKFGLGLVANGLAFALLMFALSRLVSSAGLIPFWTLTTVYLIQTVGELCLSPIGLSMVTKLAPTRLVGFGMGGWFLSTAIGDNLSGIFASHVSGEGGMTTTSALSGYTFGFWTLVGAGVLLFLIAPLIQRLMHGVK